MSTIIAVSGGLLLYTGFAWTIAQGLQAIRRRHPLVLPSEANLARRRQTWRARG